MRRSTKRFWSGGEPFIWLTGGALTLSLILVTGLIALILVNGLGFFWPKDVARVTLADGAVLTGQIVEREPIPDKPGQYRIKLKVANRDLYGADFQWVPESQIARKAYPPDVAVIERTEWGMLIGTLKEVREGGQVIASGPAAELGGGPGAPPRERGGAARDPADRDAGHRRHQPGAGAAPPGPAAARAARRPRRSGGRGPPGQLAPLQQRYDAEAARLAELRKRQSVSLVVQADRGKDKELPLAQVIEVIFPNRMGLMAKSVDYAAGLWRFVWEDPREANTEGGVFPAIFGTVLMVLIMSIIVTPLGVLAAFYLREYARQGAFVSVVRIAVNNLAGVPSIVFGVFGVGFFIYFVGGGIDRLFFSEALPTPTYRDGRHPVGVAHAGASDRARRHRGHRGRPGGDPPRDARGVAGPVRHQARDHAAGRAARGDAVGAHRAHPGHGARGGRGGAAHDHGRGQARADASRGRHVALSAPGAEVHAPGLSHLRRRASSRPTWTPPGPWSSRRRCSCC